MQAGANRALTKIEAALLKLDAPGAPDHLGMAELDLMMKNMLNWTDAALELAYPVIAFDALCGRGCAYNCKLSSPRKLQTRKRLPLARGLNFICTNKTTTLLRQKLCTGKGHAFCMDAIDDLSMCSSGYGNKLRMLYRDVDKASTPGSHSSICDSRSDAESTELVEYRVLLEVGSTLSFSQTSPEAHAESRSTLSAQSSA